MSDKPKAMTFEEWRDTQPYGYPPGAFDAWHAHDAEIAALHEQLAAKDVEIAKLKEDSEGSLMAANSLGDELRRVRDAHQRQLASKDEKISNLKNMVNDLSSDRDNYAHRDAIYQFKLDAIRALPDKWIGYMKEFDDCSCDRCRLVKMCAIELESAFAAVQGNPKETP